MVWDTLFGAGGSPSVNDQILGAIADWKASARGVILDHRAGNGGTLDAATNMTKLVRPPGTAAVIRMPLEIAGDPGPVDAAAGLAIFTEFETKTPYAVGDAGWATTLPVALITHRDGSASDYMPYGMKGAPNLKIFGPHQTAGAFSTFIDFQGTGISIQFASGETIGSDGSALIGHGVEPDFVVMQKQSDLVAGKDSLFEAALAWVRAAEGP
jgi:C-terminal processing protease CtpA/Prc